MCAIIVPTQRLGDSAKTSIEGGDQKSKRQLHDPTRTAGDTEGEKQPKAHNNQPHQPPAAPPTTTATSLTHKFFPAFFMKGLKTDNNG